MKDRESLVWIKAKAKKQSFRIIILSIANIILALIGTGLSVLSKFAIDAAANAADAQGHDEFIKFRNQIIVVGIIILCTILFRMILRIATQSMTVKAQAGLEMSMRLQLYQSIIRKNYSDIMKYHSGELINRLTSDMKIVTEGVTSIIPTILFCVFQFLGAFIVLVSFDWRFTILFLAAGIVLSVTTLFFRKKLKSLHKAVQETDGKVRSFYQESIESILAVKTFGVEDKFAEKGDILQKKNYDMKMKRRVISICANTGFSFIFNAGYLFALIWCALKVCAKTMSFGTLTAMLQLISQIQTPFFNITKVIPQYYSILASAERIIEIENIQDEQRNEPEETVKELYDKFDKGIFKNIRFSYGRDIVLKEGNADFSKGEFVAIRGISGIGKSTLFKLLLGVFRPDEGEIKLCFKDGEEVTVSPDTRRMFAYVPQGNFLFSGTIRENLTLIKDADDETIKQALIASDIYDFVSKLPNGMDTKIGENAMGLSEGQAQRIAIARAVISGAPILLLDEATSALDEMTEKRVLENIKKLKERTCIIITHKQAALDVCDKEFIIKDKCLYQK